MTTPLPPSLDDRLYEQWRRNAIRRELDFRSSQANPEAMVIAGQPGSGRSLLAAAARRLFASRGRCVGINPDELLLTHPMFVVYSRERPEEQDELLRPAAAELAATLLAEALQRQQHLVLVCMFDSAASADLLFEELHQHRYHTTLVAPVVHPELSWRRACDSAVRQQRTLPAAHWRNRGQHDHAFQQLWEVLQWVEEEGGVDRCVLLNAAGQAIVDASADEGLPAGTVRRARRSLDAVNLDSLPKPSATPQLPGASIDFSQYTVADQRRISHRLELQRLLRQVAQSEREGAR